MSFEQLEKEGLISNLRSNTYAVWWKFGENRSSISCDSVARRNH